MNEETWVNKNKELFINMFKPRTKKEIETLFLKLETIEFAWSNQGIQMLDIVDLWNETENKNPIRQDQLLDSYAIASLTASSEKISLEEMNGLIAKVITYTQKDGVELGLFLKSALHRISTDKVRYFLLESNIEVKENDAFINVLEKVKTHLHTYDKERKAKKTVEFADILAGKSNRVSMVALLEN